MIEAVRLVPVGAVDRDVLESLARAVSRTLAVPCIVEARAVSTESSLLAGRVQHDADALLTRLRERHDGEAGVLLGVTECDVAIPIFTFVFGRAERGGRAALVSLARLRPEFHGDPRDDRVTARRIAAEAVHELGHVAGLGHCRDHACVMHFTSSVEVLDLRGKGFCAGCAKLARRSGVSLSTGVRA